MSCWRRTTVLRVPAISLGMVYWEDWHRFVRAHRGEFGWDPGWFAQSICEDFIRRDYAPYLTGERPSSPEDRLDMGLYPDTVASVPGPFLDYVLEDRAPLNSEQRSYHQQDGARPLTAAEKRKYLPVFRRMLPDFTLEDMDSVHYCSYEWYDGAEPAYMY